jgi:hypothetical protein
VLDLPGALRWTRHHGETDPVLGWYSPQFGVRVPSVSLLGTGQLDRRLELSTQLALSPQPDRPRRAPEVTRRP